MACAANASPCVRPGSAAPRSSRMTSPALATIERHGVVVLRDGLDQTSLSSTEGLR